MSNHPALVKLEALEILRDDLACKFSKAHRDEESEADILAIKILLDKANLDVFREQKEIDNNLIRNVARKLNL